MVVLCLFLLLLFLFVFVFVFVSIIYCERSELLIYQVHQFLLRAEWASNLSGASIFTRGFFLLLGCIKKLSLLGFRIRGDFF